MIDLTPLDVRSKRGDFKKLMRGYDPQEVDIFLELVAERLEELTRENIGLRERAQTLQQQVTSQSDREQAVQEALVTAQELRADIRGQAQREAESLLKEAETEGRRLVAEAEAEARTKLRSSERRLDHLVDSLQEIERRRGRFLKEFRQLLERELDVVEVEEERKPLEDRTIDLDLGTRRAGEPRSGREPRSSEERQPEPRVGREAEAHWTAEPEPDEVPEPEAEATSEPEWPVALEGDELADAGEVDVEAPTLEIPPVTEVPPPDAPVDELAAAYERSLQPEPSAEAKAARLRAELEDALDHAPPAPRAPKHDNLMLYLDTEDEA